jgi:hypothetical protein
MLEGGDGRSLRPGIRIPARKLPVVQQQRSPVHAHIPTAYTPQRRAPTWTARRNGVGGQPAVVQPEGATLVHPPSCRRRQQCSADRASRSPHGLSTPARQCSGCRSVESARQRTRPQRSSLQHRRSCCEPTTPSSASSSSSPRTRRRSRPFGACAWPARRSPSCLLLRTCCGCQPHAPAFRRVPSACGGHSRRCIAALQSSGLAGRRREREGPRLVQ